MRFSILLFCFIWSFISLSAQAIGEYVLPYSVQTQSVNYSEKTVSNSDEAVRFLYKKLALDDYKNLNISLLSKKQSLSATHYTYQVYYYETPLVFCQLKLHVSLHQIPFLIQNNLPDKTVWNQFVTTSSPHSRFSTYLIDNGNLTLVRKDTIIDEKKDIYAVRFTFNNHILYENDLSYHTDSTLHSKVFLPDPLSSASILYGGLYQDAYTKDTTALSLQSSANTGSSTVTFNNTQYNFNGQLFNVDTESYVNSFTNSPIYQYLSDIRFNGMGGILGYNTAITDDLSSVSTQLITEDYNYATLAHEQVWVSMPATYDGSTFRLVNDAFKVSELSQPATNSTQSNTDTMLFTRNELGFEDVNAFYHLNNYRDYWLGLGFIGLDSLQIQIDAHGNNGADNSFFSPTNPPRLIFGQGGVDDAEDADVIIHEYGHALSFFASPGSNSGTQRNAIDEGFGDYLAVSYSKSFTNYNWEKVFSWDGHNEFWNGRESNSAKTALDIDANQNIYYNGEIWSTVLTDLLTQLGSNTSDKFAIELMYYNMPNSTISNSLFHLFTIDSLLFNQTNKCVIFDVLYQRDFVTGDCSNIQVGIQNTPFSNDVRLLNSSHFLSFRPLQFSIKESNFKEAEYFIMDALGRTVYNESFKKPLQKIPTENLKQGIYFIVLQTNNDTYWFKILKKN